MLWRVTLTLLLSLCASEVLAQVTIPNYDGTGATPNVNEVNLFDTDRNKISATNGSLILLEPGTYSGLSECSGSSTCFAWYGVQFNCGWREGQFSAGSVPHGPPWCGDSVYTSPDLRNHNWTNHGVMFDPNGMNIDTPGHSFSYGCMGIGGGSSEYCGFPKVRYNPNTGLYVLWDALRSSSISGNYVQVFTCTSPVGGCTQHTQITFPQTGVTINDLEPLIDGANIYFFHTDGSSLCSSGPCAYVEQLDSTGTLWSSTLQQFPSIGEGTSAFKRGSNFYYLSGSGCNYCSDAVTQYWITTTSISSWPTGGQAGANILSHSTCNAENFDVTPILTDGGSYVMKATRFSGPPGGGPGFWPAHGLSNEFWYPLTFTGTNIDPIIGCPGDSGYPGSLPASVVIPNVTPSPPPVFTADQTSESGTFGSHCDITAPGTSNPQLSRMQTFTPSQSYTGAIEFMVAQCNQVCSSSSGPGCFSPDSNLEVAIYHTTGSGTAAVPTGSPIATYIANPQNNNTWAQGSPNPASWVPKATQITGVSLTAGVTYALVYWALSPATMGSYTSTYDQTGTNPYPRGFEAHSSNWPSGNTWVVDNNVALKFSAGVGLSSSMPGGGHRIFR
jgi:hypothetical protein